MCLLRFGAVYQGVATARGVCLWRAYGSMSSQSAEGLAKAVLLIRRRTEYLASISGSDRSQPLHLSLVGRGIRLGRNA